MTPFLTGTISLNRNQTLSSFQDFQGTSLVNIRNISVSETQHFEADFSPHNVWHFLGGYTRSTQSNSNNSNFAQPGFVSNSADAGVRYNFRSGSSITTMGHLREGHYEDTTFENAYSEKEAETKFDWIVSEKSRLNARAAYIQRDHDNFADLNDFSGMVGNLDFSWSPTAKIRVLMSAASNLGSYQTTYSRYYRDTSFSIMPTYALSSKVTVNAMLI